VWKSSRKQRLRCVSRASALTTRESSLVSYSLETAFSLRENRFLAPETACVNGRASVFRAEGETRKETGGKSVRYGVNKSEMGFLVQRGRLRG